MPIKWARKAGHRERSMNSRMKWKWNKDLEMSEKMVKSIKGSVCKWAMAVKENSIIREWDWTMMAMAAKKAFSSEFVTRMAVSVSKGKSMSAWIGTCSSGPYSTLRTEKSESSKLGSNWTHTTTVLTGTQTDKLGNCHFATCTFFAFVFW